MDRITAAKSIESLQQAEKALSEIQSSYQKNIAKSVACAITDMFFVIKEKFRCLEAYSFFDDDLDKTILSDLSVVRLVTRGAYGKIYLCKNRKTGQLVSVKSIPKRFQFDLAAQEFIRERDLLLVAGQDCHFVLDLYFSIATDSYFMLITEYASGGDLFSLLQRVGSLVEAHARFFIGELILAVIHLHSLGIIHRDIVRLCL